MESEALLSDPRKRYKIHGYVEPGFERVLDQFIKFFEEGVEKNS